MVDTVRSAQARRQLREPESGRFKDEHKKAGFPNADALEKYERQTSVVSPPASYYDGTMSEENRELWAEGMDALQDNSQLRHNPIFLTGLRGLPATYVPY